MRSIPRYKIVLVSISISEVKVMESKIYRTRVVIYTDDVDMDGCPIWRDETIFDDLFPTKVSAIRMAQKRFAKQPLNKHVQSVWARVNPIVLTKTGSSMKGRVYNKFKKID